MFSQTLTLPQKPYLSTPFLAKVLSDGIGLKLSILEREKAVGLFNVDLFCEDQNGNYVIVENQLEKTDHDHLEPVMHLREQNEGRD